MRRIIPIIVCLVILVTGASAYKEDTVISAESGCVYDVLTDRFIYEKNADRQMLIASTTKIMTAIIAIENMPLDKSVEIKREYVMAGGSSMYLREGEKITVEELLYGLLLMSGNDAALALAGEYGGTELFVKKMNEKAKELNLKNTSFENPHGLDGEKQYSTAKELALLASYALENKVFAKIVKTRKYNSGTRAMQNHNKLLAWIEGAEGVKTGYTKAAGRCLVSSAAKYGRRFIAVTLNAPDDWNDHIGLYKNAYKGIREYVLCSKGDIVGKQWTSADGMREIRASASYSAGLTKEEKSELVRKIYLRKFKYGQVKQGEKSGEMVFYLGDAELARIELIY